MRLSQDLTLPETFGHNQRAKTSNNFTVVPREETTTCNDGCKTFPRSQSSCTLTLPNRLQTILFTEGTNQLLQIHQDSNINTVRSRWSQITAR
jgi:hypothetical protein